eukprot:scaffold36804_cov51-Phaeocystis_antarctica.AAC.2
MAACLPATASALDCRFSCIDSESSELLRAATSYAYGCSSHAPGARSLACIGLQPRMHGAAAPLTHGAAAPLTHGVAACAAARSISRG